jgi:hypothetical protein
VADWRQLQTPEGEDRVGGVWNVVVGLYDVQSGARATFTTADGAPKNEVVSGQLQFALPVPDQSCALIPMTCASQPLP